MKTLTTLAALATFTACHLTAAQADPAFAPRTERVYFGDLDVTKAPGAAAIYRRLDGAAHHVCRDLDLDRSRFFMLAHARCIKKALSAAVAAIDEPALTAYAVARGTVPDAQVRIARNP